MKQSTTAVLESPVLEGFLAEAVSRLLARSDHEVLAAVADPRWGEARRYGDWRNYVHPLVRESWPALSTESRLIALVTAGAEADRERDE